MPKDNPRPLTRDEMRWRFLQHVAGLVRYWETESRAATVHDKLAGLAHSLLATLDGASPEVPSMELIPICQVNDNIYAKQHGFDWPSRVDIGGGLHEEFHDFLDGESPHPDGFYDFADFIADEAKRL